MLSQLRPSLHRWVTSRCRCSASRLPNLASTSLASRASYHTLSLSWHPCQGSLVNNLLPSGVGVYDVRRLELNEPSQRLVFHSTRWYSGKQKPFLVKDCDTVSEVLDLAHEHRNHLPPYKLAAVWSRFSQILLRRQPYHQNRNNVVRRNEDAAQLLREILDILKRTYSLINKMGPKDLTTIILSMAKIVKSINRKTKEQLSIDEQVLSNILLDGDRNPRESIFQTLAESANGKILDFGSRYLSNLAYAFALLGYDPKFEDGSTLFGNIAGASLDCFGFNDQDIANMLWAYATLKISNPQLFKALGGAIVQTDDLGSFKSQELSNIVWAFASMDVQQLEVFEKIGDAIGVSVDLKSFKTQELSNIVWAYATADVKHNGLFKRIADSFVALDDCSSFNPQIYSNIVWAYATAKVYHPVLFKKLGDAIVQEDDLKTFDPQAFSNILWAFATANIQHPEMFNKIADAIIESDNLKSFNKQALANLAWAFAVSNVDVPLLFNDDFTKALLDRQNDFIGEDWSQLYQWHLWQTGEKSNAGLPEAFVNNCRQAFTRPDTKSSSLQKDVISQLTSLGMNPVEEYETPSGYKLDALIEIDGKKVGVEVNGPSHFIESQPNGPTLLKRRQVETIDKIPLVFVPVWEWIKLGKERETKKKNLLSLLQVSGHSKVG